MYRALWRRLPGPLAARVAFALVALALVVVACFGWVFPWLVGHFVLDPSPVG